MESEDNRKHPRYGISTEVQIHYGGRSITARAIDISDNGIAVESSVEIGPDTVATVAFGMPEEVMFYCMTVWSVRTPLERGNEHRIGFIINGLRREGAVHHDLAAIDKAVEKIVSLYG